MAGLAALFAAATCGCATELATTNADEATPSKYADMFAVWSPDGERIAFVSDRTGDPEIYTARRDGSQLKRLTDVPGRDAHPYWFPDGERIAFQSPRNGGDVRLFVMSADGSDQRELAATKGFCGVPTVSPDGAKIAFMCSDSAEEPGETAAPWRIFLMDSDGAGLRRITDGPGNDQVANWSPDGRTLVFWSNRSGVDQIYALDLASMRIAQLTEGAAQNRGAAYAPDGKRIYFITDRHGGWALYSMGPRGEDQRRIAALGTEYGIPYVNRDGADALFLELTEEGPRIALIELETGKASSIVF